MSTSDDTEGAERVNGRNEIVSRNHVYTREGLLAELGISVRTFNAWRKAGLRVFNEGSRSMFIRGQWVHDFLDALAEGRTPILPPDEV